jgi:8-oxo-dGTP pyrophosphatase MutT (NUDIX family)
MEKQKKVSCEPICRDGAFTVIFCGDIFNWQEMEFFLGQRDDDGLFEFLGGGFDLRDLTPACAASRELHEEASILVNSDELTFFANMIQRLRVLGENERGYVFYFYKKVEKKESLTSETKVSQEHTALEWHPISSILSEGEKTYKTATLRVLLHFLNYLMDQKVRFGILGNNVSFQGHRF